MKDKIDRIIGTVISASIKFQTIQWNENVTTIK